MIVVGASLNEWTTHFGKILENDKKIIQIDDREDAFGWFARIAVGLEADAKVAVAALLDRLKEGGKPGRQPDAATAQKIKQWKPPAISYDAGKWVDPRRAAAYLEDKLPKLDRILVFDGGHSAMVTVQAMSSPSADNWASDWTSAPLDKAWASRLAPALRDPASGSLISPRMHRS